MNNITYISASAGSGKTYELTERLKELILSGKAKPEELILTTYTKAAAKEFKDKTRAKLYEVGKIEEANRLDQALIGTIDSIANAFVNRYWYLLGISPKLNVINEDDERLFISESLSNLLTKEQKDFFYEFAEIFKIPEKLDDRKESGINYNFWKDHLKTIFNYSRSFRIKDYSESINASKRLIEIIYKGTKLEFDRERLLNELDVIDRISSEGNKSKAQEKRIEATKRFRIIVKSNKSSPLEIGLALSEMISKGDFTTKAYEKNDSFIYLKSISEKIWACKDIIELQFKYIDYLFDVVVCWQKKYEAYKKEQHIIDYTDMEEYFLNLLTKEEYKSVQNDILNTYKYLFVDEFQDCSPTQVKIFENLSRLVKETIFVGDYKQAIYGFRGSDVALVKAITDKIEQINGRPNDKLDTNHRSWPPIVNVCNKVFVPIFNDILKKDDIELKCWNKLEEEYSANKQNCLKVWTLKKGNNNKEISNQVAAYVAKMLSGERIIAKDIAILARNNYLLTDLARSLKEYNIPISLGDSVFQDSNEITLLNSLLRLIINPSDTMARATIAYLTEKGNDSSFILDNRFESLFKNKKDTEFLEEVSLIKKLMTKRNELINLGISALVENLIIELDLYNVVKCFPHCDNSANTLHAAIEIAKIYEEHCIHMTLPCTVDGFIDYITTRNIKSAGNSDGIQLHTYHGSKGLEWKNVILLNLNDDLLEINKMIKLDLYGIQKYHELDPNASNPYPPMIISILPWVFGSKKNIPESVKERILGSTFYKKIVESKIQEEKRLMYVAMTRPVESLVLAVQEENGLLRLKQMGVNVVDSLANTTTMDVLGIGEEFLIEHITDMNGWKYKTPENKTINLFAEKKEHKKRDLQPSSYKNNNKGEATIIFDTERRITFKTINDEIDKVGTCIHDIFCVIEDNKESCFIKQIIQNHEMENVLSNTSEIIVAWDKLECFLREKYGAKIETQHEIPFKQMINGQIFTGSIDFIWKTEKGVVLVDFKSYPGSKFDVINPEHKHFAGTYVGQLECYERALTAAGHKVLGKLIYYHTLGIGVEIK